MPVEGIQLGHGHAFYRSQDRRLVHVVSAGVQKNSAIGILRTIYNVHIIGDLQLVAQVVEDDQLAEGLHSMTSAEICLRRDVRFYLKINCRQLVTNDRTHNNRHVNAVFAYVIFRS